MAKSYEFVVLDGPDTAERPETRTLIRKQAMKEASLMRKRKGNYGRVNLGQPILVKRQPSHPTHHAPRVRTSESCDRCSVGCEKRCHCALENYSGRSFDPGAADAVSKDPPVCFCVALELSRTEFSSPLSATLSTGYERVRNMSNIDLSQLSMLASFRANTKITAALLYTDPSLLVSFLRKSQPSSYLSYVPALYSSSECLASATDCLLVKTANVLSTRAINHPSKRNQEMILHSRALHALRTALTDPAAFSDARILVSIQLLSLHELLNFSPNDNGAAWSMHVKAGATFIQARSLHFRTDLEKTLLFSHSGAILSESFSANSDCFLDQLEWKNLYNSLATTEVTTSPGDEVISHPSTREARAHSLLFSLPGLINDVDCAMRSDSPIFHDGALLSLRQRCQRLHSALRKWLHDYTKGSMSNKAACQSVPDLETHDHFWNDELLPTMFDTSLLTARLLSILTLCPRARLKREEKVQRWAAQALASSEQQNAQHGRQSQDILTWSTAQHTLKISRSILATKETLSPQQEGCGASREAQIRAMRRRYMQWHALLY